MSTFKRGINQTGLTTPNVFKSEGLSPAQHFKPAEYLPLVRFDQKVGDFKVISVGKVLAVDKQNYIVPAGLIHDIRTALAHTFDADGTTTSIRAQLKALEAGTPGTFGLVYSQYDVDNGVKNFAGDTVEAGEPVVASMLKSGSTNYKTANISSAVTLVDTAGVSKPVGMAQYDIWRGNGAEYGEGAADYRFINYNLQQGLNVLTRYFIELPVVADTSGLLLPGMTVFEGTPSHGLVTFNKRSNFVMAPTLAAATLSYTDSAFAANTAGDPTNGEIQDEIDRVGNWVETAVKAEIAALNTQIQNILGEVLGKIIYIDATFPKDYLNFVRTWEPNINGVTNLDKAPGSATSGLPDNLTYAGVTDPANAKVVKINVFI